MTFDASIGNMIINDRTSKLFILWSITLDNKLGWPMTAPMPEVAARRIQKDNANKMHCLIMAEWN